MISLAATPSAATSPDATLYVESGGQRIPLRNIWLLLLYASELFRQLTDAERGDAEKRPDELPELAAEILAREVERRLHRHLTHGWQPRAADLRRVRGRIDLRRTETRQLLQRGQIACRFDELTADTPRNRYVRAALLQASGELAAAVQRRRNAPSGRESRMAELARRCRSLARRLERLGVNGPKPPPYAVDAANGRGFAADDRRMLGAARLVFELALPNEEAGNLRRPPPPRDQIQWLRQLFEKAVGGFYDVTLTPDGWRIDTGRRLYWPTENPTPGLNSILPSMQTDIVLEDPARRRRIVIDTKFSRIFIGGYYRDESIRSANLYQIYAYLRSQENPDDPLSANSAGILLHPAIGEGVDESATIQGHRIRFATVDLAGSAPEIRRRLLSLVE